MLNVTTAMGTNVSINCLFVTAIREQVGSTVICLADGKEIVVKDSFVDVVNAVEGVQRALAK